ncbi:hypothetical protein [Alteraurantiacibacter buctensis]|uniref:Histone H1 n=1 Tax=Alteraurantiacibacter buctensis TaxID=1503981 RepID=A0A844YTW9_9SPHN|nr:hypothetical protein [Alteraurantiacibacter buctensis]MXO71765.1 histone H1 [Alteraurantiacibacter buctensis]
MTDSPKRPRDPNQLAKLIVDIATGDEPDTAGQPKDAAAQAMGKKGGQARAATMSPERRAEIARKAAAKRWSKPVQS